MLQMKISCMSTTSATCAGPNPFGESASSAPNVKIATYVRYVSTLGCKS